MKQKSLPRQIKARHQSARISASKVRLVAKMVKEYELEEALVKLNFIHKKASHLITKVLESAIANAQHNFGISADNLMIRNIEVGEGPTLKRYRARSRGMANKINKRTCHIKVILEEVQIRKSKEAKEETKEGKNIEKQKNENDEAEIRKK